MGEEKTHHQWGEPDADGVRECNHCRVRTARAFAVWQRKRGGRWRNTHRELIPECTGALSVEGASPCEVCGQPTVPGSYYCVSHGAPKGATKPAMVAALTRPSRGVEGELRPLPRPCGRRFCRRNASAGGVFCEVHGEAPPEEA